jgi:UPF0755 protein
MSADKYLLRVRIEERMKKILFTLTFFFIFLISILSYDFYNYIYVNKINFSKELDIKKGDSVVVILNKLNVPFDYRIRLYLRVKNIAKDIKAGTFDLNKKLTLEELLQELQTNSQKYIKVTIPEGYTLKQIKNALLEYNLIEIDKFEKALAQKSDFYYLRPNNNFEGFFYPDTYFFTESQSESEIIDMFLNKFMDLYPKEKFPNKEKFYNRLILASIIEKEAATDDEKPLVASVFQNRLDINMKLQSDATLAFLFDYKRRKFYYKDLAIDSPYNSYKEKGLPPTPICSPGKIAISASLNPPKTDYFYFVISKEGDRHLFSKTYQEHLRNKNNK